MNLKKHMNRLFQRQMGILLLRVTKLEKNYVRSRRKKVSQHKILSLMKCTIKKKIRKY